MTDHYTLNDIGAFEEGREHEAKGLQNAQNPVRTIVDKYVEEYINAFLNTSGGTLYFGVEDDGRVRGIRLDRSQRDNLRRLVDQVIHKFVPSVEPELYQVLFVPVRSEGADPNLCVVEIRVSKGPASLYWTGSQNAHVRRDGGNFRMAPDMIEQRWRANLPRIPPALHQLPADVPDFMGREEQIAAIEAHMLSSRNTVAVAAIVGMAGIGKSAVAIHVAHRLKDNFPDAQLYLELRGSSYSPLTPTEALAALVRAFHPTTKLPEGEAELAALLRSVLHHRAVLILLDDAKDASQVIDLLSGEANCAMLITSRRAFALPGLHRVRLDVLTLSEARALLLSICPRLGSAAKTRFSESGEALEIGVVDQIAQLCGYLPIALRVAASTLEERVVISPVDYLRRLTDTQARLKLIEAPLALSCELLSPHMQKLWCMLAVFPATFTAWAAATIWALEDDPAQDALSVVVASSLVERDPTAERYQLHELLRMFADARLNPTDRAASQKRHAEHYEFICRVLSYGYQLGGELIKDGLALFDTEWRNIEAGQMWAAAYVEEDDAAAELCSAYPAAAGVLLTMRQRPQERIRWVEDALAAARRLQDRSAEAAHLNRLGLAYDDLGDSHRAIELYERSLAIDQDTGDRHGEGQALGNMGIAYRHLGQSQRAIDFHEHHLDLARENADRRDEANALGNLGSAYLDLGDPQRAIEFYEQALVVFRETGDRRSEGTALGGLGDSYRALRETVRAIDYCEQHLDIAREIGDRQGEATALGHLGAAYSALGEIPRAIDFHEQYLDIARKIGDRRLEGNALGNLGAAYSAMGDARRAIGCYEQHLDIARETDDRPSEGNALNHLGGEYSALGDPRRAIKFFRQALAVFRENGDRHGEGNALSNLGSTYLYLRQVRHALNYFKLHLAIARKICDRQGEATALGNLAQTYTVLGQARRSILYCKKQLGIAREVGDRRGEGNALGNLGAANRGLGKPRHAIGFYEQHLDIAREIGDRSGEGAALYNLGLAYMELMDPARAIAFYEQALMVCREIYERNTEGLLLFHISQCLHKMGDHTNAVSHITAALDILDQIDDPMAVTVRKQLARWRMRKKPGDTKAPTSRTTPYKSHKSRK